MSHVSRAEEITAPSARVFAIIEDPALTADLLPRFLQLELVSGPWMMGNGERIHFRMTLWGVSFDWRLEVQEYVRGEGFVHRLVDGPLAHFEHRHLVHATDENTSRVVDLVSYRSRFGRLGRLFDRLVLRSDIDASLAHRNTRLRQMLGV